MLYDFPYMAKADIFVGDVMGRLREMPSDSVHCCVTSPPYWGLRDYGTASWVGGNVDCDHLQKTGGTGASTLGLASGGHDLSDEARERSTTRSFVPFRQTCEKCGAERVDRQIGLEPTPAGYVARMTEVFEEVRRVLRPDGVCFLNLGDSYAGSGKGTGDTKTTNKSNGASRGVAIGSTYGDSGHTSGIKPPPGMKAKNLVGIPWRVAFALQDAGWWLRQDIIWAKPNGMPGSQEDRTTSSHEHIFMLTKSAVYWSDFDAIKTPPRESSRVRVAQDIQAQAGSHRANGGAKTNGAMKAVAGRKDLPENQAKIGAFRDKQRGHSRTHAGFNDRWDAMEKSEQQSQPAMMRDVWFVSPGGFAEAHFAVMPTEIARRCVLAGCPEGGTVLDPFSGAGTSGVAALRLDRNYVGIELNPEYASMSERRIHDDQPLMNFVEVHAESDSVLPSEPECGHCGGTGEVCYSSTSYGPCPECSTVGRVAV